MPLDVATEEDPFASQSEYSEKMYPKYPPIPSFLGVHSFKFNETGRDRFVNAQIGICESEFGFRPTQIEKEGIAYYNAVFYADEARGAQWGWYIGGAVGLMISTRSKKPWNLISIIGNKFGVNPCHQLMISKAATTLLVAQCGKAYGMTSTGVQSFNRIRQEQGRDPNMQRYLEMRKKWVETRPSVSDLPDMKEMERRGRELTGQAPLVESQDEQSLGGLDFYDEAAPKKQEAPDPGKTTQPHPQQTTSRYDEDDPFKSYEDSQPQTAASSHQSRSGESVWDRIRQGGTPYGKKNEGSGDGQGESAWAARRQTGGQNQTKEDSFSFSSSDSEKQYAKQDAQRNFDERLERERQGHHQDEFAAENPRR